MEEDNMAYRLAKRQSKRVVAKAQDEERQRYCDVLEKKMAREICSESLSK
jgi:hypothetical protein